MRDRSLTAVMFLGLAALCAYLVRCLTSTTQTDSIPIETMKSMTAEYSKTFSEVTKGVTDLAETLILGRDLPISNDNSQTNRTDEQNETTPSIDLNDLPETARWAAEAEEEVLTTMPWQSSKPLDDLES